MGEVSLSFPQIAPQPIFFFLFLINILTFNYHSYHFFFPSFLHSPRTVSPTLLSLPDQNQRQNYIRFNCLRGMEDFCLWEEDENRGISESDNKYYNSLKEW